MAAERGLPTVALVAAVSAALEFDDPADEQSVEMQELLRTEEPAAFTSRTTGLDPEHPLFPAIRKAVAARQQHLGTA